MKKYTAFLLVADQACTDIRGAVPTAAASLLDFDYISGVICHRNEGCDIEIGKNVVMHKSVTTMWVLTYIHPHNTEDFTYHIFKTKKKIFASVLNV